MTIKLARHGLRASEKGATVTFLLRRTEVFDTDEVIQEYLAKGKVRLVKGDALNKDQVQHGWAVAGKREGADGSSSEGGVDVLLFTVGKNRVTLLSHQLRG